MTADIGWHNLPLELVEQIVIHLPIDVLLVDVSLACRSLLFVVVSVSFARRHFRNQLMSSSESKCIWSHLDARELRGGRWRALPGNYRTAIYGEILLADDWDKVETNYADQSDNLMWSERWPMGPQEALDTALALLSCDWFNPNAQHARALRWAARHGHELVVKCLLADERVDPACLKMNAHARRHIDNPDADDSDSENHSDAAHSVPIVYACEVGHENIARMLLNDPRVDPSADHNRAIRLAAKNGHANIVALLLQHEKVDPTVHTHTCLLMAAQGGHLEVVRVLLQHPAVDPAADSNFAVRIASWEGYPEIVRLLLERPQVNPNANDMYALRAACVRGHVSVLKLLCADERVQRAVTLEMWMDLFDMAEGAGQSDVIEFLKSIPTKIS